jgi:hypothetical protein
LSVAVVPNRLQRENAARVSIKISARPPQKGKKILGEFAATQPHFIATVCAEIGLICVSCRPGLSSTAKNTGNFALLIRVKSCIKVLSIALPVRQGRKSLDDMMLRTSRRNMRTHYVGLAETWGDAKGIVLSFSCWSDYESQNGYD